MRNIKLTFSSDGTDFSGWQRQPDRRTVQQVLEEAIGRLTGVESTTNASGRTDAGVHAIGQVVHFYTESAHAPATFVKALNAMLPKDVRVYVAEEVPQLAFAPRLDARVEALSLRDRQRHRGRSVPGAARLARLFEAEFRRDAQGRSVPQRQARFSQLRDELAQPHEQRPHHHPHRREPRQRLRLGRRRGRRLPLQYGALDHGHARRSGQGDVEAESKVAEVLAAEDRREAGPTAPPQGLFLVRVRYQ